MTDINITSTSALNVVVHTCCVQIMSALRSADVKGESNMDKLRRGLILVELEEMMTREIDTRWNWKLKNKTPHLSVQDSKIFRLAHHDYCPESGPFIQTEIAEILGIPQQTVSDSLARRKRLNPQLFPILTRFEAKCANLFLGHGYQIAEIAERMNVSETAVKNAFRRAKDKGLPWVRGLGPMLSYDAFTTFDDEEGTANRLDDKVKRKF